ncbi:MAG: LptF/LptG family permease [Bacteroidota bacterium]|nr:LptF/LptG family permease [Bacteroidota bacterium]
MLHRIDWYIIKKFLGTFFYAIGLIICISIVFDVSEKIDDFISKDVTLKSIIFDYYVNFVPYFANLFSGLFTFIAVIYFTSKLAYNTEIIAILSAGVSFKRLMRPYMAGASVIVLFSYLLGNYIIPPANKKRVDFTNMYIGTRKDGNERNIHRQIEPGVFVYMSSYNASNDVGYKFTIENFIDRKLVSKLSADYIKWDREKKKWVIHDYNIRTIEGYTEKIVQGSEKDTTLNMSPEDYQVVENIVETMTLPTLNKTIENLKLRGVNTISYEIEKHRRRSQPFSAFILTIIGVSLASRKIKGGIGFHLGLGLLLSFSYILFMQITTVFATSNLLDPWMAMWIPNIIYGALAFYLYKRAAR